MIAFFSPEPRLRHLENVCRLFDQSQIRGRHAFGFSVWEENKGHRDNIRTFKSHELLRVKKEIMDYRYTPPEILIGHNRYSTSGDWKDHGNNQPVHIQGISMVFNGVITQSEKSVYETVYKKTFSTENDGEIFSRKVLDGEDWVRFVANGSFSFAGLFVRNGEAYAIRNKNRPLYMGNDMGGVFFASTKNIFERAGGFSNVREVPAGKELRLDERLIL